VNKPQKKTFYLSTLSKLVTLACLSLASTSVFAAADVCGAGTTTISTNVADDFCELGSAESVVVNANITLNSSTAPVAVSAVTVDAGSVDNSGTISGAAIGVRVGTANKLTGSITNQSGATISGGTAEAILITGAGSAVDGSISNSGTLSGNTSAISLTAGGVVGVDIVNNSGATITGVNAEAILITGADSAVNGSISNTGTITGATSAISLTAGGVVAVNITNADSITGSNGAGIIVTGTNSAITGSISNDAGTITGSVNGIEVSAGGVIGSNVENKAGATITGVNQGILINNAGSAINGAINNAGTITRTASGGNGIGILDSAAVKGGITNSGTISNFNNAIAITQGGSLVGGIANTGTLSGASTGIYLIDNATADAITNTGTIANGTYGIYLTQGVNAGSVTVGSITNTNAISGSTSGIELLTSANVTGDINNSGTITGGTYGIRITGGSSVARIVNTGTIKGTTAVELNGGLGTKINVINSSLLDGAVILGDNILNINGTSSRITGLVTGTAGSTINVNGTFTTEADFTNTGTTTFNIANTGRLNLNDGVNITTSTLSNEGTLAIVDGNATTITGGYTQATGGVLEVGVSSRSSYGALSVTGAADFTASGAIDLKVSANETLSKGVLAGVVKAGSLTVGTLTVSDDSALWKFNAAVNGNNIDINVLQERTIIDAVTNTGSSASLGVASILDGFINRSPVPTGDMATVINALNTLTTESSLANAAAQLTPSFSGGVALASLNLTSGGAEVISNRITQISGLSSGDAASGSYVWVQPFGSRTSQDARGSVYGYKANTTGIAIGGDVGLNNDWRVGGAVSYVRANINDDTIVQNESLDIEAYQASVYGSGKWLGNTRLNLQASLGTNSNESQRSITFSSLNREAKGDFNSWNMQLKGEVMYEPYSLNATTTFTPSVGVDYRYVSVDGFTEKGAGAANLDVDSASEDSLVLSIGGHLTHHISNSAILTANLGVGHDFMADQSSVTSTFTGGGASFQTEGIAPASTVVKAGLGMKIQTASNLEVSAGYNIEARNDFDNQSLSVKLRWPF